MIRRIDPSTLAAALPLWDEAGLRTLEVAAGAALPDDTLMRRAGAAVARLARARHAGARRVGVLCGPGHNGADGLHAAAALAAAGLQVDALLVGCGDDAMQARRTPAWQRALATAGAAGVQLRRWRGALPDADVLLDALLGIGLRRAPDGEIDAALRALAQRDKPLLAVDLPSGVYADTGAAPGTYARADVTLSLLGLKPGLFGGACAGAVGELWHDALDVDPDTLGPRAPAAARLVAAGDALRALGEPAGAAHKGERGDVRVFGGAAGMGGALLLAARAALRLGAGRVWAAPLDDTAALLDPLAPELMLRRPDALLAQLRDARADAPQCAVFGPGAGDVALPLLRELIEIDRPLVLDADALNALARQPRDGDAWRALRARRCPAWLTPHPQEAARLLRSSAAEVQADRLRAARALAAEGVHCVLKGAGSVIATADGQCWVNASGNGLLATAGSGDVLSGALAAVLARAAGDAPAAARAAVWLHGAAADLARTQQPTLLAGELADWMLRAWQTARTAPAA